MKFSEIIFVIVCAALAAGAVWCGSRLDEPFYLCACTFLAAFWGALAGLAVWGRMSANEEARRRRDFTIIWRGGHVDSGR